MIIIFFFQPKARVKKLTIEFGFDKLQVLKDLSIDFYPNEFSVIIGHNGSGKSCLLKIISGKIELSFIFIIFGLKKNCKTMKIKLADI